MTKNELIHAVADDKAQMTRIAAASAVEATFDAIIATLRKGGEVKSWGSVISG
jgi:DNA-binding protein HU-beta